jgi:branched-chain amino acid transport system substrate-binding protein
MNPRPRPLLLVGLFVLLVGFLIGCAAPSPTVPAVTAPSATAPAAAATTAPTTAPTSSGTAAATKPASGKVSEVKIGVIYPLTGGSAQSGLDARAGVELAVDILNGKYPNIDLPLAKPGGFLGGAKVTAVYADSQANPQVGQSDAQRLITSDKVVALYGAYNSNVTKTASDVAERSGIPFVNGESSSPDLTQRGYQWFFRTSLTDNDFSKAMFDMIDAMNKQQNANIKTVGILAENTDFGTNSAKAEQAEAKRIGVTVVDTVQYTANTTSLTAEIQKLKADNPDVLIPSSYGSDTILTIKSMKDLNWVPKMILAQDAGYVDSTFIPTVGKDAEGIASRAAFNLDIVKVKPFAKEVDDLYKARTGKDLTDIPARAFSGFMTLADAINRAGSTDPAAIRKALIDTNIPPDQTIMPWKGIKFDNTGQNTLGQAIIIQVQNGQYVTIYPFDFKSANIVFPLVPWSQRK